MVDVDYALFGVFPAAVERDILIACAPRPKSTSSEVTVQNLDGSKYTPQSFTASRHENAVTEDLESDAWHLGIDKSQLRWESYVKAGYYVSRSMQTERSPLVNLF